MSDTSKPTTGTLKERISEDIKTAMKARDKVRLETVRSIKKVIIEKETEVRPKGQDELTPEQELAIIETYLPAQLSTEEIEAIIDKIIASVGASSPKDMGQVMGPAMKELKGKADGKQVQEIVKAKLA